MDIDLVSSVDSIFALEAELAGCQVVVHSYGTTELVAGVDVGERQVIVMQYQVRQDALEKLRESFGVERGAT